MDDENKTLDLTPLMKARLVWDVIDHDAMREWMPRLGLTPASEESMELDHLACHRRAQLAMPVSGLVDTLASLLAEIHGTYVIHEAGDLVPPGQRAEAAAEYADVAYRMIQSSALAIVSELLQEGLLAYGPALAGEV